MIKKFLIRLDDSHINQDYDKWTRVMGILIAHNVVPLVGIIANNKDSNLFYTEASLSDYLAWLNYFETYFIPAVHGYTHVYIEEPNPLYKGRATGEFGRMTSSQQEIRIKKAMNAINSWVKNSEVSWFVAPGHSFNKETLVACESLGLKISDGIAFWPFKSKKYNMKFMPQILNTPKRLFIGMNTFCLHPNTMENKDFLELEEFLLKNKKYAVSWMDEFKFYPTFCLTILMNRIYLYVRRFI